MIWIKNRKTNLKKFSVQERNLLLTGDPLFHFYPVVYDCFFFSPKCALLAILQNNFAHIIPDPIFGENIDIPLNDTLELFNSTNENIFLCTDR